MQTSALMHVIFKFPFLRPFALFKFISNININYFHDFITETQNATKEERVKLVAVWI